LNQFLAGIRQGVQSLGVGIDRQNRVKYNPFAKQAVPAIILYDTDKGVLLAAKAMKKKKRKSFIADGIIWDNFERFREKSGWTYAEVAREMKVSPQHLAQIKARTLGIGPETLARMVKAFGKKEEDFLEMQRSRESIVVPEEIVAIYPRAGFIVDMLLEAAKVNPSAERLLEYAIDLLKTELSRERMRIEDTRRKSNLPFQAETKEIAPCR
jgi:transcriptional regulator with XRE-family HTH domain